MVGFRIARKSPILKIKILSKNRPRGTDFFFQNCELISRLILCGSKIFSIFRIFFRKPQMQFIFRCLGIFS